MKDLGKEKIQPCWICGKVWKREDTLNYSYFNGILVCDNHDGVKEWWNGALKMSMERERLNEQSKHNG